MCDILDKAGVPRDAKWRTLILYIRSLNEYDFLTDEQKVKLQKFMLEILETKQFTDENYQRLLRAKEQILVSPYLQKLQAAIHDTQELIKEFQDLLNKRKGNVEELGNETIKALEVENNPDQLIGQLRRSFQEVVTAMEEDAENLVYMSRTDSLTNLFNRRAFDELLDKAVEQWEREKQHLTLLMLDIDHFKTFNDTYGHRIGDQALSTVAKLIREYCQDTLKSLDYVEAWPARYGGEEFTLILNGMGLEEGADVAEELRDRIGRYNFVIRDAQGNVLERGIKITVSIGVSEMDPMWRGAFSANLIDAADQALYEAKAQGRNRVIQKISRSAPNKNLL